MGLWDISGIEVSVTQPDALPPLDKLTAGVGLSNGVADAGGVCAVGIQAGTINSSGAVCGELAPSIPVMDGSSVAARLCPGVPWVTGGDIWANTAAKPDPKVSSAGSASPKTPDSPGGTGVLGCKTDKTSSFMCVTGRPVVRTTASASVHPSSKKHDRQDLAASAGGVEPGGTGIA